MLVAIYTSRYLVEHRSHWKKQETSVGICWWDKTSLKSTTGGQASLAAAFLLGLSTGDGWDLSRPEEGAAIHLVLT